MALNFVDGVVRSRESGVAERTGSAAQCAECGGMAFAVFQIHGQEHPHLQCTTCGTSYCFGGKCGEEVADGVR